MKLFEIELANEKFSNFAQQVQCQNKIGKSIGNFETFTLSFCIENNQIMKYS